MLKLKIITTGKCKDMWLQTALEEYKKRLAPLLEIHWVESRTEVQMNDFLSQENKWIALDPQGELLESKAFSKKITSLFDKEGSRLVFAIGGPSGFFPDILKQATWTLSLSPLTFTHQVTGLVFMEQTYRALEIQKGSPYHKE